jgi:antitoxin component YwqK of YwqJK toxin-antitoxin module
MKIKIITGLLIVVTLLFVSCGNETRYTYYEDGELKTEAKYNDENKLDGEYIKYFQNGNKSQTREYEDGIKVDDEIIYYENGEIKLIKHYEDGKKNGEHIAYYKNGEICAEGEFEEGKGVGKWEVNEDARSKPFETMMLLEMLKR